MALPIKPKDTQEGCNPISSNCVIWQGPDIPCIKLCTGDSVSDTVAKLAEELCIIIDQLDISVLDISCFGAIAPEPGNFADVIQLLINKTCTVETVLENNGFDLNPNTSTCPDDCLVSVATCLQPTDALGNLITELPLRDYVVLIGTRICTIVSQINAIDSSITNIETRITVIEQGVADIENSIGTLPTITSVGCVGRNVEKSIETFLLDFESSYCSYVQFIGDGAKVTSAINGQCTGLEGLPQLANPRATMANISGWVPAAQYTTLADAVSNLWRTVCDMREALITLQASNASCCGLKCSDIDFSLTASGIRAGGFIDIYFTGDVPVGFETGGGAGTPISVIDAFGNIGVYFVPDIITNINTGTVYSASVSGGVTAVTGQAIWYAIGANLQVTDPATGLQCDNNTQYEFYNENWCQDRNFTLVGINIVPNTNGALTLNWSAANNSSPTTYVITLNEYFGGNTTPDVVHTATVSYSGGVRQYAFPGTYGVANRYQVTVRSQQSSVTYGLKEVSCDTDIIRVPN
jgi:hypothetical protein